MEKQRKDGPVVLVDSGDSFFPAVESAPRQEDKLRADLIAQVMGQLHYDAIAVGEHDLGDGLAAYTDRCAKNGLTPLSANLADATGKHPFQATKLIDTPDGKVGIFGVNLIGADKVGLHAEDPLPAMKQAISELRKQGAKTVIALVHGPAFDAGKALKGLDLDVALYAHDGRLGVVSTEPPAYGTGQKGRQLMRIAVDVGVAPIRDGSATSDAESEVKLLDDLYAKLQERKAAATTDQARAAMDGQMRYNRQRREQVAARTKVPTGRVARYSMLNLDDSVGSDEKVQAAVDAEVARDGHSPMR